MAQYIFFEQGSSPKPEVVGPFEEVSIATGDTLPYLTGDGKVQAHFEYTLGGWVRRYKDDGEPEDVFSRLRFSSTPQ